LVITKNTNLTSQLLFKGLSLGFSQFD